MTDDIDTHDFATLVRHIEDREELQAAETLTTLNYRKVSTAAPQSDLPRVDHLVALGALLGAGGIGEVVSARQASLDREIAVKRPRRGHGHDLTDLLLREARVIGFLEHPNIPPVHFVGSSGDDSLIVGLKRIEGETLTERLQRERPGENLDENLDILIDVCNAVGYAHALGIVHLDIKPDNVMTGHYGEVYVLDWGLAVAWRDDVSEIIPRQPDDDRVRGTPAFLPKEMITSEPPTPATDVYLLGGLLHYFLTHEPPNPGESGFEALHSAYEPPPREFDESVSPMLADICRRALQVEPEDRYANADEFRDALLAYRKRRREFDAVAMANRRVATLRDSLSEGANVATIYQEYGAARQAIDELARLDTEGDTNRPMLQQTLEAMVDWELGRANVGGAELLLAELPTPNPELDEACRVQRERLDRDRTELASLRADIDPSIGMWTKLFVAFTIGVLLALSEWIPYLLDVPTTTGRVLGGYVAYVCLLGGLTVVSRETLFATRTNRGLILLVWQLSLYALLLRVGGFLDLLGLHAVYGYDLLLVFLSSLYAGAMLDRRVLAVTPIYAIASPLCFAFEEFAPLFFGTGHFVALSSLALALRYIPAEPREPGVPGS